MLLLEFSFLRNTYLEYCFYKMKIMEFLGERKYIFQSITRGLPDLKILENICTNFNFCENLIILSCIYQRIFAVVCESKRTFYLNKKTLNNDGKWLDGLKSWYTGETIDLFNTHAICCDYNSYYRFEISFYSLTD
jgi:hypothetical protein